MDVNAFKDAYDRIGRKRQPPETFAWDCENGSVELRYRKAGFEIDRIIVGIDPVLFADFAVDIESLLRAGISDFAERIVPKLKHIYRLVFEVAIVPLVKGSEIVRKIESTLLSQRIQLTRSCTRGKIGPHSDTMRFECIDESLKFLYKHEPDCRARTSRRRTETESPTDVINQATVTTQATQCSLTSNIDESRSMSLVETVCNTASSASERASTWSPKRESNSRPTHYECLLLVATGAIRSI